MTLTRGTLLLFTSTMFSAFIIKILGVTYNYREMYLLQKYLLNLNTMFHDCLECKFLEEYKKS